MLHPGRWRIGTFIGVEFDQAINLRLFAGHIRLQLAHHLTPELRHSQTKLLHRNKTSRRVYLIALPSSESALYEGRPTVSPLIEKYLTSVEKCLAGPVHSGTLNPSVKI